MAANGPRRVLLLHPNHATAPDWQELERHLPEAERVSSRDAAIQRLESAPYNLIVSEARLPGGTPFRLLSEIISRQQATTLVVHFSSHRTESWLKIFEGGQFDLHAEPISSEKFFRWLQQWLAEPVPVPSTAL